MKTKMGVLCGAAGALFASQLVSAGPSDYVYTPRVTQGEREIDVKMGTAKTNGAARASAVTLGLGYGASERWFTELYVKYKRDGGQGTHYDAVEWENKFQLTETGEYPVDVGLLVEIERPKDRAEGWEVKWGPLLQTQFGRTQLNGNVIFKSRYRSTIASDTELLYQWQAKYLWQRSLDFGVQGFGEVGKWDDWAPSSARSHRAGPAIFGKLSLGDRQVIAYNAAWLFGTTTAAPDNNLRLQVEYEF